MNSSFTTFCGTSNVSVSVSVNLTMITAPAGTTVEWRFYTNDTANNWNVTDIRRFVVESECFIATAAYGTPLHEDIDVLRDFRDKYLMTNPTGRTFVGIYYKTSPPIADAIRENEGLRTAVRSLFVTPIVYIADAVLT